MDLFYIRHHFQSIRRSTSFDGEVFAFILLSILFGGSALFSFTMLDDYALEASRFFGHEEANYHLFLMLYLFMDLVIRLVFRRPLPKLKYYVLWGDRSVQIANQYMITSLIGVMPLVLFITLLAVAIKAFIWLGIAAGITIIMWWIANHYIGLTTQFSKKWVKGIIGFLVLFALLLQFLSAEIASLVISFPLAITVLVGSIVLARSLIRSSIERREIEDKSRTGSFLESLPVLSFKNPVFQLEWALIVRNKRTRSNILLGLISVLVLPFVIDNDSEWMVVTLVYFITTGFFIIQHGTYSLGWEGSYFDFLLTNISPKRFIKTRYLFYVGTCVVGFVFATIPTLISGLSLLNLSMIFLYNIGVTIPITLYRSTLNDTKIILTENSFMNYNGMMTGPIFVSSFLVMLIPLFIYGVGQQFMGLNAIYLMGGVGIVGLILFQPLTDRIAKKYHSRKYHLSQSFKA